MRWRLWIGIPVAGAPSLLLSAALTAQDAESEGPRVERVEVVGHQYLQKETLLFYISTKPGDRLRRAEAPRGLPAAVGHRLPRRPAGRGRGRPAAARWCASRSRSGSASRSWTTGAARSSPPARSRTRSRSADAQVKIDTFYDPAKARKVEAIIKEMLAQKGRPFATVKHEAKNIGGSGQQLSFVIDDGPKAKVHEIVFDGNHGLPGRDARGQDEEDQEARLLRTSAGSGARPPTPRTSGWGARRTRAGDRGRLEDFYLDHGYVTARVGQPKISYTDGKSGCVQEEAGQADAPRDPGDRGRAVPDGGPQVRGAHRPQGGVRPRRTSR